MKVMSKMCTFMLILLLTGITVSSCTTSTYTEKKSISTEPVIGTSTEPVIGTSTEPVIGTSTEPVIGTSTEPVISTSTEPVISTAPWEPPRGERAKFTYRYFPSSFVYFNIDRGIYFYLSEGKWVDSYSLPQAIPIDRDDYVILKMIIDKPYMFHKDVVKKHPPPSQTEETKVP
jgi:hypothetical protein